MLLIGLVCWFVDGLKGEQEVIGVVRMWCLPSRLSSVETVLGCGMCGCRSEYDVVGGVIEGFWGLCRLLMVSVGDWLREREA